MAAAYAIIEAICVDGVDTIHLWPLCAFELRFVSSFARTESSHEMRPMLRSGGSEQLGCSPRLRVAGWIRPANRWRTDRNRQVRA